MIERTSHKELEQRFRRIVETAQEGIWLLDSDGRTTYVNQRMYDLLGYTADEMHGRSVFEYVTEDMFSEASHWFSELKSGKRSKHDIQLQHKNGRAVWISASASPLLDDSGHFMGSLGMVFDITEPKKMEKALKESEEKYRSLVENALDGIIITQQQRIAFSNSRADDLLGCSKEGLLGIPLVEFIHPEDRKAFEEGNPVNVSEKPGPALRSFRITNKKERELWVEHSAVPISWEGNRAALHFFRDLTQQRRIEIQLFQAQKMEAMGTLAGGIAHDFNNILQTMIFNTELALQEHEAGTFSPGRLKEILKASERATELVRQILAFSRQTEQDQAPVQISVIVKEALKMLRASLPSTIQIKQNITAKSAMVLADPTQVYQIIMNLCSNAAHAMIKKGGILEIKLTEVDLASEEWVSHPDLSTGCYVSLSVRDTGQGMDKQVMDRIFDPFFTTKKRGEGSGMGLAVVQEIVKGCGGAVLVGSKPGEGSIFEVLLPKIQGKTQQKDKGTGPPPKGTECLLVVDDEVEIAALLGGILERLGYKVVSACESTHALEIFRQDSGNIDLVITDQTMPRMTGAALSKEMLRIRPGTPIILCTGFSEIITEAQAKDIGIREFIMKPFIVQEIAETVRKVLDGE